MCVCVYVVCVCVCVCVCVSVGVTFNDVPVMHDSAHHVSLDIG